MSQAGGLKLNLKIGLNIFIWAEIQPGDCLSGCDGFEYWPPDAHQLADDSQVQTRGGEGQGRSF